MKFLFQPIVLCAAVLAAPLAAHAVCNTALPADAPDSRYEISGDTVKDKYTGLMWRQCSEGLSGANCATGTAITADWQGALNRVAAVNAQPQALGAGYNDWRLPNKNELASLVSRQCESPAINANAFPGTISESYWSNSPFVRNGALAWLTDFSTGDVSPGLKTSARRVRLVRAGN